MAALEPLLVRVATRLVAGMVTLLPQPRREWGCAILAEIEAVPRREQLRFISSAARAVAKVAATEALHGRVADAGTVVIAACLGLLASMVDLNAAHRSGLWLVLGTGCLLLGVLKPRGAWRWGVLAAVGLPLTVQVTGFAGPYAHDRGDVWFPILPCIMLATLGALIGRRWLRHAVNVG